MLLKVVVFDLFLKLGDGIVGGVVTSPTFPEIRVFNEDIV